MTNCYANAYPVTSSKLSPAKINDGFEWVGIAGPCVYCGSVNLYQWGVFISTCHELLRCFGMFRLFVLSPGPNFLFAFCDGHTHIIWIGKIQSYLYLYLACHEHKIT